MMMMVIFSRLGNFTWSLIQREGCHQRVDVTVAA
jgi:hypothetical protein